jgi:hypothetical protein
MVLDLAPLNGFCRAMEQGFLTDFKIVCGESSWDILRLVLYSHSKLLKNASTDGLKVKIKLLAGPKDESHANKLLGIARGQIRSIE